MAFTQVPPIVAVQKAECTSLDVFGPDIPVVWLNQATVDGQVQTAGACRPPSSQGCLPEPFEPEMRVFGWHARAALGFGATVS